MSTRDLASIFSDLVGEVQGSIDEPMAKQASAPASPVSLEKTGDHLIDMMNSARGWCMDQDDAMVVKIGSVLEIAEKQIVGLRKEAFALNHMIDSMFDPQKTKATPLDEDSFVEGSKEASLPPVPPVKSERLATDVGRPYAVPETGAVSAVHVEGQYPVESSPAHQELLRKLASY